ncbi:MAG: V-type ATP synthase subunit I [Eubacterium sp.]|nr:V-type ATP synthase subunit I [Eubacterium sp.]
MIIPMKKAKLIALKSDREALLLALQRCGEFMAIAPENESAREENAIDAKAQKTEAMLRLMQRYGKKKSFFEERPEIDYQRFVTFSAQGEKLAAQASDIADALNAATAEIAALRSSCEQLEPWLGLDIPLERIGDTASAKIYLGYIPSQTKAEILEAVQGADAQLELFDHAPEGQAALLAVYAAEAPALMDAVKLLGYLEATLPRAQGTPREICEKNQARIETLEAELQKNQETLTELAEHQADLELLNEQYKAAQERQAVAFGETVETVFMEGWVRGDRIEVLEKAIQGITEVYDLTCVDPQEGEQPPTVTENPKFWKPFESITNMYSPPKPGTIDPTPVSAPWFWVIFGMMMGDFGYGAIMALGTLAFKKIKKPKGAFKDLINLLLYSSITTMLFGILFGSYFGETWHPILFSPLDDPVMMLVLSLVVGVLHLFSGMALKIVEDVRSGHVLDAIFDQVSWMLLITGAGLMFLAPTRTVGIGLAVVGAVIILFTAGRDKPSIVGKVTGGVMGLYNVTSYLSDILSYSRILALSLATGVIAMVMNLLAGMVQVNIVGFILSLLIYFIGHVFNISMSLLSAYVHDSRLQYIEFFNKFYDGGGYEFKPLAIRTTSIDVVDAKDKA